MPIMDANRGNTGTALALAGAAGAAAFALSFGLGCGSAQAKEANKTIWQSQVGIANVRSGSGMYYTPVSKTTKKYDITGDKKADKLKMQVTRRGNLILTINGHKAKTIKPVYGGVFVKVKYLKLKNGRPFLYVVKSGENADGPYAVYQGKRGNKLVKVISNYDFPQKYSTAHRYLKNVRAKGNKLIATYEPMTYAAGLMDMTYTFKYSKVSGKIKRTSATTSKVRIATGAKTIKRLHPVKKLKLYTSAKAKKVRGYAAKGGKLSITKVCLKGGTNKKTVMFKVKTASGMSGWFKAPKKALVNSQWQTGPGGGTLFRETMLAG
jgi:hypothetical protein